MSPYGDDRLDDRFKGIDKALADVQYDIRVLSPIVAQVGRIEANVADTREELRELRQDYKSERETHRKELQDERARSRGEILKLIGVVVGFFSAVSVIAIGTVLTGLVG